MHMWRVSVTLVLSLARSLKIGCMITHNILHTSPCAHPAPPHKPRALRHVSTTIFARPERPSKLPAVLHFGQKS